VLNRQDLRWRDEGSHHMKHHRLFLWAIWLWCNTLLLVSQVPAQSLGMVTGSKAGTYFQFGQDLARLGRTMGMDLMVKESEGSTANIRRLVSAENAALAIVQSDVLGFLHRSDDPEVRQIAERLRLVFPFYNEEVHLFARQPIHRFEDLEGKRVVVGTQGSGNWLTSSNLLLTIKVRPAERIELPPPEAVHAVLRGEADAMFYVAGKPVKLFTALGELQKEPRYANLLEEVHFVPLSPEDMLREYGASTIGPDDYGWVVETVPTVAVKAVLISYDFSSRRTPYYRKRCGQLFHLGRMIRDNMAELKQTGHPKWKEIDLEDPIGIWERDPCSHARPRAPETGDDLLKAITETLKGQGRLR
jgi:TRAP transporter TAXI family solute receptor